MFFNGDPNGGGGVNSSLLKKERLCQMIMLLLNARIPTL